MKILYTFVVILYYIIILLYSIINKKARDWFFGRINLFNKITKEEIKGCIWFHAASLGEYEQLSILIQKVKEKYPKKKILLTLFSPSGYNAILNDNNVDFKCYLPFDLPFIVDRFIEFVEPDLVFWNRYDFWFNVLGSIHRKKIRLVLINGVFEKDYNFFYKIYLKKVLKNFSKIYCIDKESLNSLNNLEFESKIIRDTRYDRMIEIYKTNYKDKIIENFIGKDSKVIIAGSIWVSDIDILQKSIETNKNIKFILVPHDIENKNITIISNRFDSVSYYSNYNELQNSRILIVDKIGLLKYIYRYADVVYIGGGFGKVVHSIIEALVYDKKVIIGKNIEKSAEAKYYVKHNYIKRIETETEFNLALDFYLKNEKESSINIDTNDSAVDFYLKEFIY